jgi:hypothetical protein
MKESGVGFKLKSFFKKIIKKLKRKWKHE